VLRWTATIVIAALFVLNLMLPGTSIGRRGNETQVRDEAPGVAASVGQVMPDFTLADLEGEPVRLSDLRGHRVLLTFERSVDW
jgi:cytochrome oxidase Cu insertion factor (SCO1/SenC/PrrC family)